MINTTVFSNCFLLRSGNQRALGPKQNSPSFFPAFVATYVKCRLQTKGKMRTAEYLVSYVFSGSLHFIAGLQAASLEILYLVKNTA